MGGGASSKVSFLLVRAPYVIKDPTSLIVAFISWSDVVALVSLQLSGAPDTFPGFPWCSEREQNISAILGVLGAYMVGRSVSG